MKTLYFDCAMGAAGDMLTAALLELIPDGDEFVEEINALGIPGVTFKRKVVEKCGIMGTGISVSVYGEEEVSHDHHEHHHDHAGHEHSAEHHHEHHHHDHHGHSHEQHEHDHGASHSHSRLGDIEHLVRGHLPISEKVKDQVMAVYQLIAEAESKAHGKPVSEIHFHEVGTMDAVADITAVCLLMEKIAPDEVVVSPIHVGSGQVKCAHGVLPIPAPATAHILRDVPIYGGSIKGELCTPTGAALLKHFATRFGDMPIMRTEAIGYGMGKKDFPAANCVRAFLGETAERKGSIVELACSIDDMTGEAFGYAMEVLFTAGALEVYNIPISMKKSRPGTLLSVICEEAKRDEMVRLIFQHTTTIGIKEQISNRHTLKRSIENVSTSLGTVRKKVSQGYGIRRQKYEYEDIAEIARQSKMSLDEVCLKIKEEDK